MTGSGPTASRGLVGGKGQLFPCLCIHPEVTPLHHPSHTQHACTRTQWFPEHGCLKKVFFIPTSQGQVFLLTSAMQVSLSTTGSLAHLGTFGLV